MFRRVARLHFYWEHTLAKKTPLKPAMFKGALAQESQMFPRLGASIAHTLTFEDVIDPGFWYPQIKMLDQPGTRIFCEWECGSRSCVLRVMGVDRDAREVIVAIESKSEMALPDLPSGFSLEYVNKGIGWRILEDDRRSPRRSGFATAYAAAHWLRGDRGPTEKQTTSDGNGKKGDAPKGEGGKGGAKKPAETATSPAAPQ